MDNQLLITWTMMIVVALGVDIGAYVFLRFDWKKNGSTLTDRFWNQLFKRVDQVAKIIQNRIAIALVNYHRASTATDSTDIKAAPTPKPVAVADAVPAVEIIPVSVKNIGGVRRVKFSLDMPLNSQIEVRIGATREAGVTVEKREL